MSVVQLLKKYGVRPRKSLGQNFLHDENIIIKIVNALAPAATDKVLEIGAGIGFMTRFLTERAKFVAAVECDATMVNILENELGDTANLQILHGDILDTNLTKLASGADRWLFIGNIPYNITSPLLIHLRDHRARFARGVLTMQKEVGLRLLAKRGEKNYGILSVTLQACAVLEKCFTISPQSFFPEPEVESIVIRITFPAKPQYEISDWPFFNKVVRAAFSTRRKMLKNALAQSNFITLSDQVIQAGIKMTGIGGDLRAEELGVKEFVMLAANLKKVAETKGSAQ